MVPASGLRIDGDFLHCEEQGKKGLIEKEREREKREKEREKRKRERHKKDKEWSVDCHNNKYERAEKERQRE